MKSAQSLILIGFLYKIIVICSVNCNQYFEPSGMIPVYNNDYQSDCSKICSSYGSREYSMYETNYCNCNGNNKQYIWEDVTNQFQSEEHICPYQTNYQTYPAYSNYELPQENAYHYESPSESLHSQYRNHLENAYNQNYHYIEPDSIPMQYNTDHGEYYIMKDNIPILHFSSNLIHIEAVYAPKERESNADAVRNSISGDNATETTPHVRAGTTISTTEKSLVELNSTIVNQTHNATARANLDYQNNILNEDNNYGMTNPKQYKRHVFNGRKSGAYNRDEVCKALGRVGIECDFVFRQMCELKNNGYEFCNK